MLVGLLALSLAFTGCAADAAVGDGDPAPFYLQGDWEPDSTTTDYLLTITPLTATYGSAPYRISVTITSAATVLPDVVGRIEFWEYFTGEVVGTVTFEGTIGAGATGDKFTVTASDVTAPFFAPGKDVEYTKR